jgi:succinate--hydroxymethylglutarate CoA-transferase
MLKEIVHRTLGPVTFLNTPLRFQNSRACVEGPPPAFAGEHTDEILTGLLKLTEKEIGQLREKEIVS